MLVSKFRLGLVINPIAGIGGSVGLKGSDGEDIVAEAIALGAKPKSAERCRRALEKILLFQNEIKIYAYAGNMGENLTKNMGFEVEVIGAPSQAFCSAADTEAAARFLCDMPVDLLLFVGGDGTARNIFHAVGARCPVLGVPAGVKMHSGVYAVSPEAAGEVLNRLLKRTPVPLREREVRDIDEMAFRQGRVKSKYYGALCVPEADNFLQGVKNSGHTSEPVQQRDIAAGIIESMLDDTLYIIGPGSTTLAVMEEMTLTGTLLGVDLVCDQQLLMADVGTQEILQALKKHSGPARIIITAIGGQGHILGRGNQQISPAVLRLVGRDNVLIIATASKLEALQGRPLLMDSNDPELDKNWSGYSPVIVGYNDTVIYPLGNVIVVDASD